MRVIKFLFLFYLLLNSKSKEFELLFFAIKIATFFAENAESEVTRFSVFFPRKNCEIKLHVFTSFCFFISEKNNVNLKCND